MELSKKKKKKKKKNYIVEGSSGVGDEIFEYPSVVIEDIPLLHLVLIDVSSVCLCRMLGP